MALNSLHKIIYGYIFLSCCMEKLTFEHACREGEENSQRYYVRWPIANPVPVKCQ